jgi:putative transposase
MWLPIDDAATAFGVSRRWVEKLVRRYNLPTRKEKAGRSYRTLVDVGSLSLLLKGGASERPPEAKSSPEPPPSEKPEWFAIARIAKEYQDLPRGLRWEFLQKEASRLGVTPSYLARWVREYLEKGAQAFRKGRRDKGGHRVPAELRRLVVGLKLAHPKASARRILRIIALNDERVLYYRPYSTETLFKLSEATVRRILRKAEENPAFRWALLTEEGRREFARTWAGHVLAEYPMQMVMVDMTRCDTFVYIPEEDRMVRLRIHAAIDVFSGAVPSLVFSREEGQVPTDQLLILMTQDKTPLVPDWDVRGVPEKIYWDNGKVYRSEQSERWAKTLGVELIYSRPRVSHTRGKVERFFGAFHNMFEALLPGYAGRDATERDSSELRRLFQNTRRWVLEGMPPERDPWPERLLLEDEYKQRALQWLISSWHRETLEDGLSRKDLFRAFVPRHRLLEFHLEDLYLLTAYQAERKVRGNGTVEYRGRTWYLDPKQGSLLPWQGQKVVILDVQVLPGQPLRVALKNPDGTLKVLGELLPEPLRADSLEARAKRAADRAAIRALQEEAKRLVEELAPAVRMEEILERLSGLAPLPARRERVVLRAQQELPAPSPEEVAKAAAELEAELEDDLILDPIALGEQWLRERGHRFPGEEE